MSAKRTRANGRASRQAILDAALQVFAERGLRGTSLTEIAGRVGMTQPGLLHHFGSKEQLLLEVVQTQEERTGSVMREHLAPELDLVEAIESLGALNQELRVEQLLLATLSTEAIPEDHPLHDHFVTTYRERRRRLAATLRDAQAAGRVRGDIDADAVARDIVATLDGLRLQWLLDPKQVRLTHALSTYARRVAAGLAAS